MKLQDLQVWQESLDLIKSIGLTYKIQGEDIYLIKDKKPFHMVSSLVELNSFLKGIELAYQEPPEDPEEADNEDGV